MTTSNPERTTPTSMDSPSTIRHHLALFFSHGTSLATWEKHGLFDREVGYYQRLLGHMDEVTFVTYDSPPVGLNDFARKAKPINILHNRGGIHYRLFGLLAPLLHYGSLKKCTLLKTNQISGAWTGVIAKWILHKPLLVRCGFVWSRNMIRMGQSRWRIKLTLITEGAILKRADSILVATQDDRQYILNTHHVMPDNISVVPNPIDTDRFCPDPTSQKREGLVVFVGRLGPEKNVDILVRAILETPGANLLVVGTGPQERTLRSVAGLNRKVRFCGSVPNKDIPPILNRAQGFVLPSRYEGSPKALLEAMACGLPVIGTDVPGIRNVINHGTNGLLCKPDVSSLKRSLATLLEDHELRKRLGQNARRYVVEHHSEVKVAEKEMRLIHGLLEDSELC